MKTPMNPSRKATARVKNPLPVPTECIYCRGSVELVHHDKLYGRAYSDWPWVYMCQSEPCKAYVGLHPFTNIPLGTLATSSVREARKVCKPVFTRLHESGRMSRTEAYSRLAEKLGIPVGECHFAWFNVDQCHAAAHAAREIFLGK